MKTKFFALIFFLILTFFAYKVYAQPAGLTSIMSQNKIRTCLQGGFATKEPKGKGNEGNPELGGLVFDTSKFYLTGTCEAPGGCEVWLSQVGNGHEKVEHVYGWKRIVNHVAFGKVNIVLKNYSFDRNYGYKFYAIGDAPVITVTGTDQGGAGIEAENQTQQIGEVSNFEFEVPATEGSQQSCARLSWDPFGRVFDAVSLEPISGVNVSLFQDPSKQLVSVPNNPALTDKRGVYNILIDTEGDYYLNITSPATHSFTGNVKLNPKYESIYSHIYSPGVVFHEGPLPLSIPEDFDFGPYHHDIPLQPKGEPYRQAVAEVVEGSLNQADLGSFVNYQGQVTYPMAKVCLVGEKSGAVGCINADKYGNFNISVDKLSVPQEFLEIKVEKVDLTKLSKRTVLDKMMSFFVKEVNAQTSIKIDPPTPTPKPVGFNPILSYIEGYAYDEAGKIIPNARIVVMLNNNDEVFYQTTADESGFFTIYSNNLPFFEYYLNITSPSGKTVKQTTTEFIVFNKDYLTEQDLDLIKATQGGSSIVNPETGEINTVISTPVPTAIPQQQAKSNNPMVATAILLLFLTIALGGIVFYIFKKRK